MARRSMLKMAKRPRRRRNLGQGREVSHVIVNAPDPATVRDHDRVQEDVDRDRGLVSARKDLDLVVVAGPDLGTEGRGLVLADEVVPDLGIGRRSPGPGPATRRVRRARRVAGGIAKKRTLRRKK